MPSLPKKKLAAGTNSSVVVDRCQVCDSVDLEPVIFIGYLPPVNTMPAVGTRPAEQPAYPAELLRCRHCQLVQLGLVVDPAILSPRRIPTPAAPRKSSAKISPSSPRKLLRSTRSRKPTSSWTSAPMTAPS